MATRRHPTAPLPGTGGLTSCGGQADGTKVAGSQICCVGLPIPATSNGRCPALFHGSANGVSAAPIVGAAATASGRGYWLVARDGGVFTYGDAAFLGSLGGKGVNDIVGIATDPAGTGYWLVGADGGVFSFGTAAFGGSLPGQGTTVSDIVGIAANPAGSGYWLAGKDGTVYALGGAPAATSAAGVNDIVGIAANPVGPGYWLVGADGGVFALAGAPFDGSLPAQGVTVSDVVGIAANPEGHGYWLLGAVGGVFTFGSGNDYASNALHFSSAPLVGMTTSAAVFGYWMAASDGEVFVAPNAPPESTATALAIRHERVLPRAGGIVRAHGVGRQRPAQLQRRALRADPRRRHARHRPLQQRLHQHVELVARALVGGLDGPQADLREHDLRHAGRQR